MKDTWSLDFSSDDATGCELGCQGLRLEPSCLEKGPNKLRA